MDIDDFIGVVGDDGFGEEEGVSGEADEFDVVFLDEGFDLFGVGCGLGVKGEDGGVETVGGFFGLGVGFWGGDEGNVGGEFGILGGADDCGHV